jgi:F-type H+-transporting ATPase subunit b
LKGLKIFATAGCLLLLAASLAFAAEHVGGHGHGEGFTASQWKDFMWRAINFVVFAAIIYKAGGKKIAEFFRSRKYNIETELKDLEQRKADTQAKLAEVDRGIANLEAERAKILDDYKAQGEALKQNIIEAAEKSAEKIREQAKMTASSEAQAAVDAMRAQMAELIVQAAEQVLKEKLSKEEHEKLVDNYLTKVVFN